MCIHFRLILGWLLAWCVVSTHAQDVPESKPATENASLSLGEIFPQGRVNAPGRLTNYGLNPAAVAPGQGTEARQIPASKNEILQQQPVMAAPEPRSGEPSEFQKFMREATGTMLPMFGTDFFANAPSTFAPIQNSPIPADYPLGPGDEILIRGWGSLDIDYRTTIDRHGLINLPTIGSVVLGGVRSGDAQAVIRRAVEKLYKGVTINVTFGQLKAITIYVVGQARRPGSYTVSSLSTLVTAVFASGGPNATGSLRRIQVRRANRLAAELDLYHFLTFGDKSADIKLQDGDTIVFTPAAGYVALAGMVNNPAIYELRTATDTIDSILAHAGGLPIVADPRRVSLERIDPKEKQPRMVEQFALDQSGLKRTLKNGDLLTIAAITPEFANAVTLRGNVSQAIREPFRPGMRVSDLIRSRETLISRASIARQNETLLQTAHEDDRSIAGRIGSMMDNINWDYAVVERIHRADLSVTLIPFKLGRIFEAPESPDNISLQPGDIVTVFSQTDVRVPIDKRRIFVRVEGEVNVPGVYQMTAGDTLPGLLARAGGPTGNAYLFGVEFYREQVRTEQQTNMDRALRILEAKLRNDQSKMSANLGSDAKPADMRELRELQAGNNALLRLKQLKPSGRISFGLDPADQSFNKLPALKLQNGDQLIVPNRSEFVHVYGAVYLESAMLWQPGSPVSQYLLAAGPTQEADLDAAFVIRADGSIVNANTGGWRMFGVGKVTLMPGDSIVVPEKFDKETAWTKFIAGAKDWAQIFQGFGLGAAAIKTLRGL